MTEARSKRRVLPLVFIVKSFTKSLLIKVTTFEDFQIKDNFQVGHITMLFQRN